MTELWIGSACTCVGGLIVFVRLFLPRFAFWDPVTLAGAALVVGGILLIQRAEVGSGSDCKE
ncbi:MAG: hypothetical protein ABIG68_14800 [Acidobacteriota bacterium]